MIKTKKVKNVKSPIFFRESKLAHEYCKGTGVEIGAAAHNQFRLPSAVNVAPADDQDFYQDQQVNLCGEYAVIDHFTEADKLVMFEDESLDYVISSHVFEHLPDPIAALKEWHRVLRDGGVVFMIVPKRDAHPKDRGRDLSTLAEFQQAHEEGWTVDTISEERTAASHGRRGHYWVFSLESLVELVQSLSDDLRFTIVATAETDDKVGNGHTLVLRKREADLPTTGPVEDSRELDEEVEPESEPEPEEAPTPKKPRRKSKKDA